MKKYIEIIGDDSPYGFESATEILKEKLEEFEEDGKIIHIENANKKMFNNIFDERHFKYWYDFEYNWLYYEVDWYIKCIEDIEEREDLEEQSERDICKLSWVEIELRWYCQSDWDCYYIVYDNTKTDEEEILNHFGILKNLFTISTYTASLYEENDNWEKELIDRIGLTDYGDSSEDDLIELAKENLWNYETKFLNI